jgi:hypothetical protein
MGEILLPWLPTLKPPKSWLLHNLKARPDAPAQPFRIITPITWQWHEVQVNKVQVDTALLRYPIARLACKMLRQSCDKALQLNSFHKRVLIRA